MKYPGNYLFFASLLLLLSCSTPDTSSNRWTRFRGSGGSGIDANRSVPVTWDPSDYKWNITLPGKGNASPVVWNDRIFITSGDDEKDIGYLFAIDGQNGEILWKKEFTVSDLQMHVDNNLAAATPAVDDKQVYVVWYSRGETELTALDHNGNIAWRATFQGMDSRHGGGSSLMLTEKYVVFTIEQEDFSSLRSSWIAVDKKTGETVWDLERESAEANSFATPLLLETDGHPAQVIFASQAHGLTGVELETGKVLWERKSLLPARVVASPVYAEGMFIPTRKGETVVIDLDPGTNHAADSARYTLPRNLSPYVPTPIVVDGLLFLFVDNGTVACVRLETGELLWKEKPAGGIYGSPICVDNHLYCLTRAGEVLVIRADSTYQLSGIQPLGDGSFSTPVMCKSGMVFRTFSRLFLLGNS